MLMMLIKRRTFEKGFYKNYGESTYKKKNHFKKVLIKIMEKVLIKITEKVLVNKKNILQVLIKSKMCLQI